MAAVENVPKHPIPPRIADGPEVPYIGPNYAAYLKAHAETVGESADKWWAKMARETLHWDIPFQTVRSGCLENGDIAWFPEGYLNASYNCIDRWAHQDPDKVAIIYEPDDPADAQHITYSTLLTATCQLANVLISYGVREHDTVTIYMPTTWQAVVAMLACARIGAVHSFVFGGFSAESLRERIRDSGCRVVLTADEGRRGGRRVRLKEVVDRALEEVEGETLAVEHVLVLRRTGAKVAWVEGRDKWWDEEVEKVPKVCPPKLMNAEDPLFILYTSGSTGKPKGIVHTTGGYLLGAAMSLKYVFDVHPNDRFGCMADLGWITGHTYVVYGPLLNGVATTVFESTPTYPNPGRFWETIDRQQITHLYTAPTAVRLLRRLDSSAPAAPSSPASASGYCTPVSTLSAVPSHPSAPAPTTPRTSSPTSYLAQHTLASLRVIGTVGEPIDPESWNWLNEAVGRKQCAIVDTFFQTETGSIVVSPMPGAVECKAGSATVPGLGIEVGVVEGVSGEELRGDVEGVLVIKSAWPSIARTVWKDHKRYIDTYMKPYPGHFYTGDAAMRDKDGYIWIKGRVDDVINVSGHRLSTSEIEAALVLFPGVAESAVIGANDELTGQAVHAFVTLKPDFKHDEDEAGLVKELVLQVRKVIGPFATPKKVYVIADLPKTRSGKIMRRVMRKIVAGEADELGDLSTLADPSVVDAIMAKVAA